MQNKSNKINIEIKKYETSKAGWISIATNITLFILKLFAGLVSNSVAIIADAWHTLSDSITSLMIVISGRYSNKPADLDHPYGHGRLELIISIVIGVFLSVVGFNFVEEAYSKIISKETAHYGIIAIVVTIISIVVKELLAQYSFKVGNKINSQAIKADGWHHRSDSFSSIVILVGIFVSKYFWWMDAFLGFCIALFLFYTTYEILKTSIDHLLGKSPDKDTLKEIKQFCYGLGGENITPHHYHFHDYGNHVEITFHIQFHKDISLHEAHSVATKIEEAIRDELGYEATIHMEPYNSIDY